MNPTDQARKEARRRELKKNKKQRQMVRFKVYTKTSGLEQHKRQASKHRFLAGT